jgi:hypothetical protein
MNTKLNAENGGGVSSTDLLACVEKHPCGCGTADRPHNIGEYGCVRHMVEAPKPAGKHEMMGCKMWDVGDRDGLALTDLTLREQRGYWQHPCGCWSRWPGSSNSI